MNFDLFRIIDELVLIGGYPHQYQAIPARLSPTLLGFTAWNLPFIWQQPFLLIYFDWEKNWLFSANALSILRFWCLIISPDFDVDLLEVRVQCWWLELISSCLLVETFVCFILLLNHHMSTILLSKYYEQFASGREIKSVHVVFWTDYVIGKITMIPSAELVQVSSRGMRSLSRSFLAPMLLLNLFW